MAKRKNHKAAPILAEWAFNGFTEKSIRQIAKSQGVGIRTIRGWRMALKDDQELAALYEAHLKKLAGAEPELQISNHWALELNKTLLVGLRKQRELIESSTNLSEVNESVNILTEIQLARDVIFDATSTDKGKALREAAEQPEDTSAAWKN